MLIVVAGTTTATSVAQPPVNISPVPGTQIPGVRVPTIYDRPIDQGIADRDELATSLRQMPGSMREDRNFEYLWVLESNPDYLYRKDGGLTAVFPASEYALTRQGTMIVVPAGTIYYIGEPTTPPAPPQPGLINAAAASTTGEPRLSGTRIDPEPAPDRLEAIPPAEKITPQIAATPERRVITPQLANEALNTIPEAVTDELPPELREDEHTMSNEAYRRLRLRNLTIRLAEVSE